MKKIQGFEVQETKNLTFGETQDTNKYRPKSSNN